MIWRIDLGTLFNIRTNTTKHEISFVKHLPLFYKEAPIILNFFKRRILLQNQLASLWTLKKFCLDIFSKTYTKKLFIIKRLAVVTVIAAIPKRGPTLLDKKICTRGSLTLKAEILRIDCYLLFKHTSNSFVDI